MIIMRRIILIVLLIATLASNSRGEMSSCKNNHAKQRKEFIKDLERRIQKNQNLTNELIAEILNSNQAESFLIQSNSSVQVNFSALSELYMTSIPAINSFLTGSLLPSLKSPLNVELNATLKYVKILMENQTELNYLIGYLYLNDMIQYVSGTTGEQKVMFSKVQNDTKAARILNCFVEDGVDKQVRLLKQQQKAGQGFFNQLYGYFFN